MKTYKAELTIPVEQYGNIRPTIEGSAFDIVSAYWDFAKLIRPREGVDEKTMNVFIDNMLLGNGKNSMDVYQSMSKAQMDCVQVVKRSMKRLKARGGDEESMADGNDEAYGGPGKGENGDYSGMD